MVTVDIALTSGLATATLTPAGAVIARGIPYGVAERFHAATPFPAWAGRRDATRRGPACPQSPSRLAWLLGDITDSLTQDENCLVLSVTAPADAAGLPVMVWFHGGAYLAGSGEAAVYDADNLALEGEVVVVSVSYRLGLFGYLTPDGYGDSNVGLRDQLLALRWVQENIEAFGGDPGQVTAFGQSAGADSVLALILTPAADGLFHRAILQSAPLQMRQNRGPMTAAMRTKLREALRRYGSTPTGATIRQLLNAQADISQEVAAQFPAGLMAFGPLGGHIPMVSPDLDSRRLKAAARRIELLIGHTAADAAPFVAMAATEPGQVPAVDIGDSVFREAQDAMTRAQFKDPEAAFVKAWTEAGGAACTYRVDWAPPGAPMGACHCIEIPLLFGAPQTWAGTYMLGTADDPIDHTVAKDMRRSWHRFARTGVASTPTRLAIGA